MGQVFPLNHRNEWSQTPFPQNLRSPSADHFYRSYPQWYGSDFSYTRWFKNSISSSFYFRYSSFWASEHATIPTFFIYLWFRLPAVYSSNCNIFRPEHLIFGRKLFAVSTNVKCTSTGSFPNDKSFFSKFLKGCKGWRPSYAWTMSYNLCPCIFSNFFLGMHIEQM